MTTLNQVPGGAMQGSGKVMVVGAIQGHHGSSGLLAERARLRSRVSELTRSGDQLRTALKRSVELLWLKDAEIKSLRAVLDGNVPPYPEA